MDLELIKKMQEFNLTASIGFDGIDDYGKYKIAYHNKIKDCWYNFITDIDVSSKEEFDKIINTAEEKMKEKNRQVAISVLPYSKEVYDNLDIYLSNNEYELVSEEVWQIFDDFENVENIDTRCEVDIKLEVTEEVSLYADTMIKSYQTGEEDDPYGNLDSAYRDAFIDFKDKSNDVKTDFYLVKLNDEIIGVSQGVYNNEFYAIYSVAVKKEYRAKGIGKEIIKKQLKICKENNIKLAFLQTEKGFYPEKLYQKLGFKNLFEQQYYIKK